MSGTQFARSKKMAKKPSIINTPLDPCNVERTRYWMIWNYIQNLRGNPHRTYSQKDLDDAANAWRICRMRERFRAERAAPQA